MTEEEYENYVKFLNLSKNFIVLKQKNFNDEINIFFMNRYYSETWNYVKLIISLNEMEELEKFHSFTFDTGKTKIRRGSEHCIGTFWPSTGIAKWSKLYERF